MIKGLSLLDNLRYSSGELSDIYSYHSTKITNSSLKRGIELYHIGIDKFMGNSLISRIEKMCPGDGPISVEDLRWALVPSTPIGKGQWVDIAGLIAPRSEVSALLQQVESSEICDLEAVNQAFDVMADNYYTYEWTWAHEHLYDMYHIRPDKITPLQAIALIKRWKTAVVSLDNMVYNDAKKEFNLASRTGFGADGDKQQKDLDFENVRGDFESNSFVREVQDHIRIKSALGDRIIARLMPATQKQK